MARITLDKVTKVYSNGFEAVHELDLDVAEGEFMVLVGPSGCGKTTALRMVAGLEAITEGEVRIGDEVVNDMSPKDRDVAMVFQNYALYPHMTVAQNIGFALKLRKVKKAEIKKKVNETAELLGLTEWIDRKPGQLSGGQRQRVAMGRAIVREPKVFLMDEPLSNLDAKLRVQMRSEVLRIQRRVGVATLYVTHDQVEAMTMGDRVAVLSGGVLQQCDSPQALYDNPTNLFVAGFMGSPAMNLYEAAIGEGASTVLIGSQKLPISEAALSARPRLRSYANKSVVVGIRPEDLPVLATDNSASAPVATFVGDVEWVEALGSEQLVHFTCDAHQIVVSTAKDHEEEALAEGSFAKAGEGIARVDARAELTVGGQVHFNLDASRIHFFDATTSEAIAR
ncbi:MAG: sn-glycerol-3-phosphate ABC transporter ATP-binding protein UgpC [Acidimicrobiales bacterium]